MKKRVEDLIATSEKGQDALRLLLASADILAGEGWRSRLNDANPQGAGEAFLQELGRLTYARATGRDGPFDLETPACEPTNELLEAAAKLQDRLRDMHMPAVTLRKILMKRLSDEAADLETAERNKLESITRSLQHRCIDSVDAWVAMLSALQDETPPSFVDWFAVDRIEGRPVDVGLHRHWIDPAFPFVETLNVIAQGVTITSATLTDGSGDTDKDWEGARRRTGAAHLPHPAREAQFSSPFDYKQQTRVLIITDVQKNALDQIASAYRVLFQAANGGALGLFTAISRLKAVYKRIVAALDDNDIPLYAQHVDGLNLPTLIDIFRAEKNSCLLGTDAVRDGVDVPGDALRLIVFDRVPWPRPTILHKARRSAFGGREYDEALTRLKIKQAFGRLIRNKEDRGIFVMLDVGMPTRLCGAFPEDVEIKRVGLAEAVREITAFFSEQP
jgi:ATP-dependent DNA helicase DinG